MTKYELIETLKSCAFPSCDDIAEGLRTKKFQLAIERGKTLKVNNFLLPIRSKIKVVSEQFESNEYTKNLIEQSEHLVKIWMGSENDNCMTIKVTKSNKLYYLLFINPDSKQIYGALLYSNKEFVHEYLKRK